MPIFYEIDAELGLIYVAGFARCTGEDILQFERSTRNDPRRKPVMFILVDLLEVKELNIQLGEFRYFVDLSVRQLQDTKETDKIALVVKDNSHMPLAQSYRIATQTRKATINFEIFLDLLDAIAWLGLAKKIFSIIKMQSMLKQRFRDSLGNGLVGG